MPAVRGGLDAGRGLKTMLIDEWKCLGCKCTFETGCEVERETAELLRKRERLVIPPRRLPPPDVSHYHRDPEASKAYARAQYRRRIERNGGTVRTREK